MTKGTQTTSTSDIILPAAHPTLRTALQALHISSNATGNRLASIARDSSFVVAVAAAYDLPVLANERCGSWYVPPRLKAGSCYFKSTDGHAGEWGFSLRRLNLHILSVIGRHGGAIVVDSTRRGKRMPDALSKTIPIWIAVLNRLLFPSLDAEFHALYTPPATVSPSEVSQISSRLDGFLSSLADIDLDLATLRKALVDKPLRPLWITPSSVLPVHDAASISSSSSISSPSPSPPHYTDFHPLILCTASNSASDAAEPPPFWHSQTTWSSHTTEYIQGAADDSEGWSFGLTPQLFWTHCEALLRTPSSELANVIPALIAASSSSSSSSTEAAAVARGQKDTTCPVPIVPTKSPALYLHFFQPSRSTPTSAGCAPPTTSASASPADASYTTLRAAESNSAGDSNSSNSTNTITMTLHYSTSPTPSTLLSIPIPNPRHPEHKTLPPILASVLTSLNTLPKLPSPHTPTQIVISGPHPASDDTIIAIALAVCVQCYTDDGAWTTPPSPLSLPAHAASSLISPPDHATAGTPTAGGDIHTAGKGGTAISAIDVPKVEEKTFKTDEVKEETKRTVDKRLVRKRTAWLSTAAPAQTGRVRRRVLGVVNEFLMGRRPSS
ncbi:MAG: hypothetical protein M1825_000978 [Sarcosagium campestre]|nr:MAG: hypothetical protein M1825_000978 [Sarcosagium campestre]